MDVSVGRKGEWEMEGGGECGYDVRERESDRVREGVERQREEDKGRDNEG